MMGWDHGGWGAGEWVAMSLTMSTVVLLVWSSLVALVVWAVRSLRPPLERVPVARDRADALLAERFARGEIDSEEYVRLREVLRAGQR